MPRRPSVEKSSVYFTLLEALGKSGCAVCQIMQEASAGYLNVLFYEQVADVGLRRRLRQARGLCNWHSWEARKITTAALGVAIIAQDLLEEECARLAGLQRQPLWRSIGPYAAGMISRQALLAYLRGWLRRGMCPACRVVVEHERHALETLLNFLHEQAFAQGFEGSSGLCLPHLVKAVEFHPSHPELSILIGMQRSKYAHLVAELEEFCRKHDYRFSHEAWGAEADAWLRALEMMSGKAAVFGNDIHRSSPAGARHPWLVGLVDRVVRRLSGALGSERTSQP
jgi:hypothetical protein